MCRADAFHSSCCLSFRLHARCKLHLETKTSLILKQDENLVLRTDWTQGSWLEPLVLYHWATTTGQTAVLTIFWVVFRNSWGWNIEVGNFKVSLLLRLTVLHALQWSSFVVLVWILSYSQFDVHHKTWPLWPSPNQNVFPWTIWDCSCFIASLYMVILH